MTIDYSVCLSGFYFGLFLGVVGSLLNNIISFIGALLTDGKGE